MAGLFGFRGFNHPVLEHRADVILLEIPRTTSCTIGVDRPALKLSGGVCGASWLIYFQPCRRHCHEPPQEANDFVTALRKGFPYGYFVFPKRSCSSPLPGLSTLVSPVLCRYSVRYRIALGEGITRATVVCFLGVYPACLSSY